MTAFTLRARPIFATGLAAFTLGWSGWADRLAEDEDRTPAVHADVLHDVLHDDHHPHLRESLRGTAFPDGVLALTWDDGPDVHTLALARWLRARRVNGTFFVVRAWEDGVSEEPGRGPARWSTGYAHLPILGDLVALGHRVGNHTDRHVILEGLPLGGVVEQLGRNQDALDPFVTNELRMFRAPGGYWSDGASTALDRAGPAFASTVGPIRWDIDEKDWSASLDGLSPREVARRYVATVDRLKHGIVLLHDRVGAVGSTFAFDLARELVPSLQARGYVFAAPVLSFTAFEPRLARGAALDGNLRLGDVDGDGRADLCADRHGSVVCARAATAMRASGALPRTSFAALQTVASGAAPSAPSALADVDGDGRADLCFLRNGGIDCARAPTFSNAQRWSTTLGAVAAHGVQRDAGASLKLGDIDGDGRADACVRDREAVTCATSTGSSFADTRTWIDASASLDPSRVELADVDGDGRMDACSAGTCALSTGRAFGAPTVWSRAKELASADDVRFGDLNGDGRADACASTADGVACAFSNGKTFTASTVWLDRRLRSFELADINADGRADLCAMLHGEVHCALAP